MYQATSSQSESRRDERRRNPRHKAPSIIYAQLGSDNGGIVVNFALDGVACRAAQKLTVKKNSTLNLRLRGSGLNADVVGEIIWLGVTKREIGIRFKNLSTSEQNDIANWIEGHAQHGEPSRPLDRPQLKPMSAMPGIEATGQKLAPRSLSAALARSKAIPVDSASSAKTGVVEPSLPAPLNSASTVPGSTPMSQVVPPAQLDKVFPGELGGHAEARNADSPPSLLQPQVQQPLHSKPVPEPSRIEHPYPTQAHDSPAKGFSEERTQLVRKELAQAFREFPGKIALSDLGKKLSIRLDRIIRWADGLLEGETAGRWIPPALLAAWRQGNRRQKLLLAAAGAACSGIFALILTLAGAHVANSFAGPAARASQQQSPARPAVATIPVASPPAARVQAAPAVRPAVQPESDQPPETPLQKFADFFLGSKPDKSDAPTMIMIDPDHFAVKVWTSKSSGYYYCADSPYYKTVQPGAIMAQRDALQSGYQSILGQFCN